MTRLSDAELAELYVVAGALEAVAIAAAVRRAEPRDHEELGAVHARLEESMARARGEAHLETPDVTEPDLDEAADFHRLSRDSTR